MNVKHFREFELLRAIALVSVIMVHTTVHLIADTGSLFWQGVYAVICQLGRIGVPAFLIISGFLVTRDELAGNPINKIFRRRCSRILPPYIIWSTTFFWIIWSTSAIPFTRSPLLIFVERLITGTVSWHLYFIFLLLQCHFLCLLGVFKKGKARLLDLFIMGGLQVLFIILCYLSALASSGSDFTEKNILYYFSAYRLSLFPMYIGYFLFGRWLGANYDRVNRFLLQWGNYLELLVFVSLLMALAEFWWMQQFISLRIELPPDWNVGTHCFVCCALLLLLRQLQNEIPYFWGKKLQSLAVVSFPVYLLHEPLMGYVTTIMGSTATRGAVWQGIALMSIPLCTVSLIVGFLYVVKKHLSPNVYRYLFG